MAEPQVLDFGCEDSARRDIAAAERLTVGIGESASQLNQAAILATDGARVMA